jgi:hypothetical protein
MKCYDLMTEHEAFHSKKIKTKTPFKKKEIFFCVWMGIFSRSYGAPKTLDELST